MKNKIVDMETLTEYINNTDFSRLDDEVALYLYEHRDDITKKSLKEIAKGSYISQSSFTRFLSKHGVEEFQDFRLGNERGKAVLSNMYGQIVEKSVNMSTADIKKDIIESSIRLTKAIEEIDEQMVLDIVKKIIQHRRIIVLGSPQAMTNMNGFRIALDKNGYHVYTLLDSNGQEYMVEHSNQDDLIICISLSGYWTSKLSTTSTLEKLKESKAKKMLWTLKPSLNIENDFDYCYMIGNNANLDYFYFNFFLQYLVRILVQNLEQ